MSDLTSKSLLALRGMLLTKEISAEDATRACLDRIAATEPKVDALLALQADAALARARELDADGPDADKPLWGVPLIIKDVLAMRGAPTTCGSKILEGFVPPFDATAVKRLKDAGAVILGKANMDEFAMGSSTENSAYKVTRNPWDLSRVPGGSSGGSGAAVSARQCFASLGTDTGGSIRLPASFCGCVGLKPSYGRVSRYGMVAYGSSLDQIGPLARNVSDAAQVLQVIAGHDERDSTSVKSPVPDYMAALKGAESLKGVRIGLPKEYWGQGVEGEILARCRAAVDAAVAAGAEIVDVSLPHTDYAIATYYIVAMAEASSNLARFDGVRYGHRDKDAAELLDMYKRSRTQGFGDEVQRRIIIGTYVLSSGYYDAYYRKAAQVRRLIRQDFLDAFEKCDVICGPSCPVPAFPIGGVVDDPLTMYLMDIFTISLNLAGLPGMSIPAGLGETSGLPVGLQIFGQYFKEDALLAVAHGLEALVPPLPDPAGLR
ncbi:Glutamyl-tRNA(Gln) amidotransferase subunit A [Desulfovibrio sp. X2]|uniref:Asp-tRNA(Asn)/Glu-tRNA(Gln) amidotransferase subunit GatA n=1 Tax=Desulfovibrio sp. X2 TaxID=941449 RepID=UPI0003589DBF|nr:Asp-tRNA(Asn)/Glu-tRNA(Gln) amidotransferase subunit GatA [Desulfovibrio sp. X2]EPR41458.1 Glutamyl-tRNA(Gln) amidotransferase subunit A [Desulfovibrio sp. X2]